MAAHSNRRRSVPEYCGPATAASCVGAGGAGRQQPLTHPRVQIQVAVALQGLHQMG